MDRVIEEMADAIKALEDSTAATTYIEVATAAYSVVQRRVEELEAAARLALKEAENWIHDQLDGTSSLESALAELEPVRAALNPRQNDGDGE